MKDRRKTGVHQFVYNWRARVSSATPGFFALALVASMTCGAAEPFRIAKDAMPEIVIQEGLRPFVARAAEDVAGDSYELTLPPACLACVLLWMRG
ncbi:MAG: hypothetical protein J6T51_04955 [Kiritimatiellae bacterium]|nr:hypothetical protein [Kiritimatiellia bacterium]